MNGTSAPNSNQIGNEVFQCASSTNYVFGASGGSPIGSQDTVWCWLVRINSSCGCTCGCGAVGCSGGGGTPAQYFGQQGYLYSGVLPMTGDPGAAGGSCGCGGGNGGGGGGGNPIGPPASNPTLAPSASPPPSPYLVPPSAQGHQNQLRAVNLQLQRASAPLGPGSKPGALEVWDGRSGNLMRQYSPPRVDELAPWPVFTYNSTAAYSFLEFSSNWTMLFRQTVSAPNPSTAVLTTGIGVSFTYTNKNAGTGVYAAPPGALGKLVQNASGSWTETDPDGSLLNYDTSGNLATIQRSGSIWTLAYDSGGRVQSIRDPAGRLSTFSYAMFGAGQRLRRFTDAVGRITTFGYLVGTATYLRSITSPALETVTFAGTSSTNTIRAWTNPLGQTTTYLYNSANQLTSVTEPSGQTTQVGYTPGGAMGYQDPRGYITTFLAGSPVRGIIDPRLNRTSFTWASGRAAAWR
ncbi:MAG TPA: hypothetical protein VNH11_17965 [Pirellulales bacterium]|nr:hypothetical protein [Pirellulales bacterium]